MTPRTTGIGIVLLVLVLCGGTLLLVLDSDPGSDDRAADPRSSEPESDEPESLPIDAPPLAGSVRDVSGTPVEAARVVIRPLDALSGTTSGRTLDLAHFRADALPGRAAGLTASGGFRIEELPDGRWSLEASAPGFASRAEVVRVAGGHPVSAELRLVPEASIDGGRVVGDDEPIEGAQIDAVALAPGRAGRIARVPRTGEGFVVAARGRAVSRTDGAFRVGGLRTGSYRIWVRAPGRATCSLVVTTDADPFVVALDPGGRVIGRADFDEIGPGAATVELLDDDDNVLETTLSGRTGAFVLNGAPIGTWRVRVIRGDAEGLVAGVGVTSGRDAVPIVVPMARWSIIRGRIEDDTGEPLAGALAQAFPQELGRGGRTVVTDAEGNFAIPVPTNAPHLVSGERPGWTWGVVDRAWPGGDRVVIRLDPSGSLVGRVRWPRRFEAGPYTVRTFERLDSVADSLRSRHAAPSPRLRKDGRFRYDGLKPGRYVVTASAEGTAPATAIVDVPAHGESESVELVLGIPAAVRGRVFGADDGRAVVDALMTVAVRHPDAGPIALSEVETRSAAGGSFALFGLAAGVNAVTIDHPDYAPLLIEALAEVGGDVPAIEIPLTRGGSVSGTAINTSGRPAAAALIVASWGEGPLRRRSTSADFEGRFRFDHLPAGPTVIRWIELRSRRELDRADIEVVDDDRVDVALDALRTGGPVSGVVRVGPRPAGNAQIALFPLVDPSAGAAAIRRTKSDDFGRFRLPAIPAGRYLLDVRHGEARHLGSISFQSGGLTDLAVHLGTRSVTGEIRDARDRPVADALVRLVATDASDDERRSDHAFGLESTTRTAPDGTFELTGVAEGRWTLQASHPAHAPTLLREIDLGETDVAPVALRLGSPCPLTLVVDRTNVTRLRVVFHDERGRALDPFGQIVLGRGGRFPVPAVAAGRWQILVDAPGWAPVRVTGITTAADRPRDVPVALARGGRITIEVRDRAGSPIEGAVLELASTRGGPPVPLPNRASTLDGPPRTDAKGIRTFESVPAGTYRVRARVGDRSTAAEGEIRLADGESKVVPIIL